jgi:hypothetical protein
VCVGSARLLQNGLGDDVSRWNAIIPASYDFLASWEGVLLFVGPPSFGCNIIKHHNLHDLLCLYQGAEDSHSLFDCSMLINIQSPLQHIYGDEILIPKHLSLPQTRSQPDRLLVATADWQSDHSLLWIAPSASTTPDSAPEVNLGSRSNSHSPSVTYIFLRLARCVGQLPPL